VAMWGWAGSFVALLPKYFVALRRRLRGQHRDLRAAWPGTLHHRSANSVSSCSPTTRED
jgi:hypothetical protein